MRVRLASLFRNLAAGGLLSLAVAAGAPPALAAANTKLAPRQATSPSVAVFPIPGGRLASPQTQISFRGVSAANLGAVQVTGSRSGPHPGTIEADSDGNGGSFIPTKPFLAGELVTVSTRLNVLGARGGTFRFTVAQPAGRIPYMRAINVGRVRGDVWTFHSRPDLAPAAVTLRQLGAANGQDIFLTPQFGPVQNGPEIVNSSGQLVWFNRVRAGDMASDLEVQQYRGQPVLTWWEGFTDAGMGIGEDRIFDTSYRQVAVVRAGNGLSADLHEFQITPAATALITAFYPVYWDASSVHGLRKEIVFDSVVQEIDIPTGLVLFQWDSLDHVGLADSYQAPPPEGPKVGWRNPYDYFHINSIQLDADGNLLVSARNTWAAYKVDHRSGTTLWTLGGKHSSFRMGPGTGFAFQHDVRSQAPGDTAVTLFDDGAGLPVVHRASRGLELGLDFRHWTARVLRQWFHSPPLLADFEGNLQQLTGQDQMIGWGQQPYFTEYDEAGHPLLDGRFVGNTSSYRAYAFPWSGTPADSPAVLATTSAGNTTVFVSWNGATGVAAWRVLAGSLPSNLAAVATAPRTSFETPIRVAAAPYVAVQALDSSGNTLATSPTVHAA